MGSLNKHQKHKRNRPGRWRRDLKRLTTSVPVVATLTLVLSFIVAYEAYKNTGADDLRNKIYSPLFSEVSQVEASVLSNSVTRPFTSDFLNSIKQSGDFYRMPKSLQGEVTQVYEDAGRIEADVAAVTADQQRAVSARMLVWRSEEIDRQWLKEASDRLHQLELDNPGITTVQSMTLRHPGRVIFNARDPTRPLPGGPNWEINDWLVYPDSADNVEPIWTTNEFLYFDESSDAWFFRITRDDLKRHSATLKQFLDPLYKSLSQDSHFRDLSQNQPRVASEIAHAKATLLDRIRDPKQISDLFERTFSRSHPPGK